MTRKSFKTQNEIYCIQKVALPQIIKKKKRERRHQTISNEQRALSEKTKNDRGMKSNKNEEFMLSENEKIDSKIYSVFNPGNA
jgi:hypothetical protein